MEPNPPLQKQTKDFADPLQCNLKLTGPLRDAVINRLVEAGRTDHTTFVREILEVILRAPKPVQDATSEIPVLVEEAMRKITSAIYSAERKFEDLENEIRQKLAETVEAQPAPDHLAALASFFKNARESFDIVLTQSSARLELLEADLRKTIDQAKDTAVGEGAQTLKSLLHEARTKILEDVQRGSDEVTNKIEAFETNIRDTVRELRAQTDHSSECSDFRQSARATLDGVLAQSVEKVARLDSDLRVQVGHLNNFKESVQQDIAKATKLMSDMASGLESKVKVVEQRQEATETKFNKLAKDFAAYPLKSPPQETPATSTHLGRTVTASIFLIVYLAVGVAAVTWGTTHQSLSVAPDLSHIEATNDSPTKGIEDGQSIIAKKLIQLQQEPTGSR